MAQTKTYQFTLNRLILIGAIVLLVGGILGFGIFYLRGKGLNSGANYACEAERNDVYIYANHLISIVQGGAKITDRQLVTLEDLIDIWSECQLTNRPYALLE